MIVEHAVFLKFSSQRPLALASLLVVVVVGVPVGRFSGEQRREAVVEK